MLQNTQKTCYSSVFAAFRLCRRHFRERVAPVLRAETPLSAAIETARAIYNMPAPIVYMSCDRASNFCAEGLLCCIERTHNAPHHVFNDFL